MKNFHFNTILRNNKLLLRGLSDTNYYFLANLGAKVISFLIIPLITRMVGVEEFAMYDLFILSFGFLSMVTGMGMDSGSAILITESKDKPETLKIIFSLTIFTNLSILIFLWISASLYSEFYSIPYLKPEMIQYIFLYTLFNQVNYNTFNFIRWFGMSRKAALLNLFTSVSGTLLGFAFLIFQDEKGITMFLIGLIIGSGMGTLVSIRLTRELYTIRGIFDKSMLSQILHLSLPYVPTYLGSYLMQIADRLIVTYFFGTYTLGLYALSSRIAQIPNLILQITAKGFQPILLSNYKTDEGRKLNRQLFSAFWLSTIPINLLLTFGAKPLVLLFGGAKYLEATSIIPLIVNASIFYGSFYLFGYSFSIKRKTYYVTIITFVTIFCVYGLSILLIPAFAYLAMAIATYISAAIGSVLYIYASENLYSFGYKLRFMWLSIAANCGVLFLYFNV